MSGDYSVLPMRVPHGPPTYGFQVTGPDGRRLLLQRGHGARVLGEVGDLAGSLAFIETSYPDRMEADARSRGHLTPSLLAADLDTIRRECGGLPTVWAVHLNPRHEEEIKEDLAAASRELGIEIKARLRRAGVGGLDGK